jgi:hypothetical protein
LRVAAVGLLAVVESTASTVAERPPLSSGGSPGPSLSASTPSIPMILMLRVPSSPIR